MLNRSTTYPFLAGGGEMGQLTREYDWSATALGTPDQWPQSLKTTLGLLLHSAFPMFLWWGDDLLCFYNDAYRPSLGDEGKHPALGKPARMVWPEIWPFIGPLIDKVRTTGEPVWFEDQLVPIHRNGRIEDVYWTFSYSPAYDDDGQIGGVLVVCTETTEAVLSRAKLSSDERWFRQLIEEAQIAVALFRGPTFVIEYANEEVLRFWGRRREQVMNKPLFEALPEAQNQGYEQLLNGVYTTGERFTAQELPVTLERNGRLEPTFINFAYEPFREPDGRISGITVVCVEVTEQVLARQMLHESERRHRAIIEEAPVATALYLGPELVIDVANEAMIRFYGRGPSMVGKPVAEVLNTSDADRAAVQLLQHVYATGERLEANNFPADLTIDGVPGTYYFDFSLKPLRNADGAVYAILQTSVDVTQQVSSRKRLEESESRYRELSAQLEDQVRQRTRELTAANQELSESNHLLVRSNDNLQRFAYVASHDLQEPLRKIQSFGDLLKSQYADTLGDGVDVLNRMQSAANRMSVLIRDLLSFSRISTQRDTNALVPLSKVLNNVLLDLELAIAENSAVIDVADLPTVLGDALQLGQLFQNLISNALKFRHADTVPRIRISSQLVAADDLPPTVKPSRAAPAYHRIDVQDNGIGFDPKYVDRIFQVFQRLHSRSNFAGTGIGLAICEKVATNHGGTITATSQPGKGATFSVYLPQ